MALSKDNQETLDKIKERLEEKSFARLESEVIRILKSRTSYEKTIKRSEANIATLDGDLEEVLTMGAVEFTSRYDAGAKVYVRPDRELIT